MHQPCILWTHCMGNQLHPYDFGVLRRVMMKRWARRRKAVAVGKKKGSSTLDHVLVTFWFRASQTRLGRTLTGTNTYSRSRSFCRVLVSAYTFRRDVPTASFVSQVAIPSQTFPWAYHVFRHLGTFFTNFDFVAFAFTSSRAHFQRSVTSPLLRCGL
jgi:hypothetical protein